MYPNLKLQLWRTGVRQNRLAKLLGIDEALLSKMVNGFREPNPEMRTKIAALLHSSETWLFERTEQTNKPDEVPRF
jgi:transcriptional regulator with XRE-family HTH domain